jgi:hypothetical protein
MLFWGLLSVGVMLMAIIAWLVLAMSLAERRARRSLYRALGLAEATVEFLMERNRDVLAELSYLRQNQTAVEEAVQQAPPRPSAGGRRPNLRLVRPPSDDGHLPGEHPSASDDHVTRH